MMWCSILLHGLLLLMQMYGKCDDLDVKFADAEEAMGVKALYKSCNGKYPPTTKKIRLSSPATHAKMCIPNEPTEHYFGHLSTWKQEFSAAEMGQFTRKLEHILACCFRSDLCTES